MDPSDESHTPCRDRVGQLLHPDDGNCGEFDDVVRGVQVRLHFGYRDARHHRRRIDLDRANLRRA